MTWAPNAAKPLGLFVTRSSTDHDIESGFSRAERPALRWAFGIPDVEEQFADRTL